MALRALIFDFDGTIAETERDGHRVAYNRAFEALGLDWRWDEKRYGELLAIAGGKERLEFDIRSAHPEIATADVGAVATRIHERKRTFFSELSATLVLRPGFVRIVEEARAAGIMLAIATTASLDGVQAVLAHVPATLASFALIAAGDIVARKKPAPDIYELVLARLDIGAKEAIAVEDSSIGLASARAAGIATVVTPSLYTEGENFSGASAVLPNLGGDVTLETFRKILADAAGPDR